MSNEFVPRWGASVFVAPRYFEWVMVVGAV